MICQILNVVPTRSNATFDSSDAPERTYIGTHTQIDICIHRMNVSRVSSEIKIQNANPRKTNIPRHLKQRMFDARVPFHRSL